MKVEIPDSDKILLTFDASEQGTLLREGMTNNLTISEIFEIVVGRLLSDGFMELLGKEP